MPSAKHNRIARGRCNRASRAVNTALKVGDPVIIIAGGSGTKKPLKGKIGKIKKFVGDNRDRVIIEGMNYVTKHKRQSTMQDKSAKIQVESGMHISNVMYWAEKVSTAVRLRHKFLTDGKKVRGYLDPKSKDFVQV